MAKPDGIPQDVWSEAMGEAASLRNAVVWQSNAANEIIALHLARATLAERARCEKACDVFDAPVSDSDFVNGQATAAQQIRAAIRSPDQKQEG